MLVLLRGRGAKQNGSYLGSFIFFHHVFLDYRINLRKKDSLLRSVPRNIHHKAAWPTPGRLRIISKEWLAGWLRFPNAKLSRTEKRRGRKAHYFDSVSVLRLANENHFVTLYPACLTTYSGSSYTGLMGCITDRDKWRVAVWENGYPGVWLRGSVALPCSSGVTHAG